MVIQFTNVKKRYDKSRNWALNNFCFEVMEQNFCALIGNNGCGKTTTINLICNLMPTSEGIIRIFKQELKPDMVQYRRRLGIVLSEPTYIDELNVVEYLRFVCKFQEIPNSEVATRINDITDLLGLHGDLKNKIASLSKGNQMKVSLCSALIHNPELLVLDEPFVHLDVATSQLIINTLKTFKGKKTLLVTSHNIDLIADLCDRFLIMDEGKLLLDLRKENEGSIDALKNKIKNTLAQENLVVKKLDWLG